jgi:putative tryptophan/tyrosine transport system substrate-binding protein
MRRREFATLLSGAVAAWPLGAQPLAAQTQMRRSARIGCIGAWYSSSAGAALFDSFRRGMRELGYIEGQNLTIVDIQWLEGEGSLRDQAARAVAELIQSKIDVLVVQGPALDGVMTESGSLPIVTVYSGDPVEAKLVTSIARPGGNVTGIYLLGSDLAGKQLALLKEVVPSLSRVAVVMNPQHPGDDAQFLASQSAAQRLGLTLQYADVRTVMEVNNTLDALARDRVSALLAFPSLIIYRQGKAIAEFSAKQQIPTMSGWRDFAIDGNLLTYGPNPSEAWRSAATYVDKILKGSKPADLPIELPTKYELVINLRTAKALGLTIPPTLLATADEVIE